LKKLIIDWNYKGGLMLSKEAIKSKKKFKRVGWLIKSIALNPTKLIKNEGCFSKDEL
jgi:hypothetical protein